VVSTTIMVERPQEGHAYPVQRPVYYVSEVLSESKVRYPAVQKLLYAILMTSQKLRHYFEAYQVTVITEYPLADILHNPEATGRITKWTMELGALHLECSLYHRVLDLGDPPRSSLYVRVSLGRPDGKTPTRRE